VRTRRIQLRLLHFSVRKTLGQRWHSHGWYSNDAQIGTVRNHSFHRLMMKILRWRYIPLLPPQRKRSSRHGWWTISPLCYSGITNDRSDYVSRHFIPGRHPTPPSNSSVSNKKKTTDGPYIVMKQRVQILAMTYKSTHLEVHPLMMDLISRPSSFSLSPTPSLSASPASALSISATWRQWTMLSHSPAFSIPRDINSE